MLAPITSFEDQIKTRIDHCQHAELTLALFLIERSEAGGTYTIGLSKASCYWCSMWLDVANTALRSMAARKTEVVVRATTRGKRTDGWLLPQDDRFARLFLVRFNAEFRKCYDIALASGRREDLKSLAERDGDCGEDVCGGQEPDFD